VPRRIFGPRREKLTNEWRKLHKEELNDLHSSSNILRVKSRRMRLAGLVTRMGREEVHTRFTWGNLRGYHLEETGVDGRIILRWNFLKWKGARIGLICIGIGTVGGHL
jgi:hypothetical protein